MDPGGVRSRRPGSSQAARRQSRTTITCGDMLFPHTGQNRCREICLGSAQWNRNSIAAGIFKAVRAFSRSLSEAKTFGISTLRTFKRMHGEAISGNPTKKQPQISRCNSVSPLFASSVSRFREKDYPGFSPCNCGDLIKSFITNNLHLYTSQDHRTCATVKPSRQQA
jgi:hypothetical protein